MNKKRIGEEAGMPNVMPQDMSKDLSAQIQKDPSTVVNSAWDNAMKQIQPKSANDWNKVVSQTSQSLGLAQQNNPSLPQQNTTAQSSQSQGTSAPPMQSQNILYPSATNQNNPQTVQKPINTQAPAYPNYGYVSHQPEAIERAKKFNNIEEPEYTGMTKLEYAQQLIKDMKKRGSSDNNILFSMVNRLFIDVETAKKILNNQIKNDTSFSEEPEEFEENYNSSEDEDEDDEDDESQWEPVFDPVANPRGKIFQQWDPNKKKIDVDSGLQEDNIYNHMHVNTSINYPYSSYNFDMQRDPFEWELNSTQMVARTMIVDQRYNFEARFEIMKSNMARWPHEWKFLKDHDINEILKISVDQLNANYQYMRLAPDSQPIYPAMQTHLVNTMGLAFKSYQKLWGKSQFQIVVLSTDSNNKVEFIQKLGKELAKNNNLKLAPDLAAQFMSEPNINTVYKPTFYCVLKNSAGHKIRESKETDDYDYQQDNYPLPGTKIDIESSLASKDPDRFDKLYQAKKKELEKNRTKEDTESSAFMGEVPENVAGLVDLSASRTQHKKIPFGGQTGDEINRQSREHLRQMIGGGLEQQLE